MKTVLYIRSSDRQPSILKGKGFLRGAHANHWQVQSATLTEITTQKLKDLITFWDAAALVCDCGGLIAPPNLQELQHLPTIWISCRPPSNKVKAFTVNDDSKSAAVLAAKELLQLGLTHFAFVHFPHNRLWSNERAAHFNKIICMHGYDCHEFKLSATPDMQDWLNRLQEWMTTLPRPCGIFAANDEVSNHIRGICRVKNWKVPNEISIIGVDNDESICEGAQPLLSSILADNEQMGFLAAQMLAARLNNPNLEPMRNTVPPLMVVRRESTRPYRASDEPIAQALELIRERACEGLRARDVIAVIRGSRRTAEMRFKEATGHSILEEIIKVRLHHAQELLVSDTTRPIKVVGQMCGYSSETAFRRVYTAYIGPFPKRRPRSKVKITPPPAW